MSYLPLASPSTDAARQVLGNSSREGDALVARRSKTFQSRRARQKRGRLERGDQLISPLHEPGENMNATHATIAMFAAVSLTLGLGCATPADMKPIQQWNQAAVTKLAGGLVSRVENARATANKETVQVDRMESVSSYLDNLRMLETQCRHLQAELQAGKGYSETLSIYDEIKQFYRVVQESPSWHMIEDDLGGTEASVAAVLRQLDGYYGKR